MDSHSKRDSFNSSDPDNKRVLKVPTGCGENIRQYLQSTSLHGLKYVGSIYITYFERAFFLFSVISVLVMSLYFISNVYEKWSSSPVIVTLDPKSTSIADFPFPAVTVCNMNKARHSKIHQYRNGSIEDIWLQNICYSDYANISISKSNALNVSTDWDAFRQFLLNISQPCSEMLLMCRFGLETFECMKEFRTVLSDEGLCCIFNSLDPDYLYKTPFNASINLSDEDSEDDANAVDWSPEMGYLNPQSKSKVTPRPAVGPGSHMGLHLILNAAVSDYHCSTTHSAGFKILLHSPNETPRISEFGMLIAPGREARVLITPRINSASRLIRKVKIDQRQCVFANEANLTYFRTYTRKNCEMECFSRLIEQECGCLLYFLPIINKLTRICTLDDITCYNTLRVKLERTESSALCHCRAGCDEFAFIGEISSSTLRSAMFRNKMGEHNLNISDEQLLNDIAVVQIYYADSFYRSFLKEELIGFTEFLSNTGGLLGLFMGFSVVSLVEIFYFLTLRPCFRRIQRRWADKKANKITPKPQKIMWINGNERIWNTTNYYSKHRNLLKRKSLLNAQYYPSPNAQFRTKENWIRPYLD